MTQENFVGVGVGGGGGVLDCVSVSGRSVMCFDTCEPLQLGYFVCTL